MDALLYFGSIRTAYQRLRQLSDSELLSFFARRRIDGLEERGETLHLSQIAKDNRYLISEMACKSFGVVDGKGDANQLEQIMIDLLQKHYSDGGGPVTARQLLTGDYATGQYAHLQPQLQLSVDDFMEEVLEDEGSLVEKIRRVAQDFTRARRAALSNTDMYFSMAGEWTCTLQPPCAIEMISGTWPTFAKQCLATANCKR